MQVNFSGDVAQMENARIKATLRGDRIERGGYEITTLEAAAEWSEQRLRLTKWEWTDRGGRIFRVRPIGIWRIERGEFQIHSSILAKDALMAFGFEKFLADANFAAPPQIELSGSFALTEPKPRWNVIGRVALGNFSYKAISILGLTADLSWDGERTMLRDVRLRHADGRGAG